MDGGKVEIVSVVKSLSLEAFQWLTLCAEAIMCSRQLLPPLLLPVFLTFCSLLVGEELAVLDQQSIDKLLEVFGALLVLLGVVVLPLEPLVLLLA